MGTNSIKYYLDILIVIFLGILSMVFVLVPPLNESPLRIIFSLPIMLFVPGYMFISAMFPKKKELSHIERFTLAVGFSIAISVFDGFLLSISPWLYRPTPTVISLLAFSLLFAVLTLLFRQRLPEEERFILPTQSIKNFFKEYTGEIRTGKQQGGTLHALKVGLGLETISEVEDKQAFEISKILIIAMILSIIIASGMLIYAKTTREPETFTALYILGADGKAENYPTEITLGEPISVIVGIENYEQSTVNYTLDIQLDSKTLDTRNILLDNGKKWEENISIITNDVKAGSERSKLEFKLFKGEEPNVYRSVNLWLNNSFSRKYLIEHSDKLTITPLPTITNGDFTQGNNSWTFFAQSDNITSTVTSTGGKQHVFVINSTLTGKLNQTQNSFITQSFNSTKGIAALSFNVNTSSGKIRGTTKIYVLFNGVIVWAQDINKIKQWLNIRLPVTLNKGTNTLTFRIQMEKQTNPFEVYLDDIGFKPLSTVPLLDDFEPPASKVAELTQRVDQTSFIVSWNGTDSGSGINYYNIDYSTDGVTWTNWLNKTRETSATFNGTASKTYYFRSQASDKAGNTEQIHTTPDTSTTIDITLPKITIRVDPNPTRGPASFSITSSKNLSQATAFITHEEFKSTTNTTLTSINGTHWSGTYNAIVSGTYLVIVEGIDEAGNKGEGAERFIVNTNIANLTVDITPTYTNGGDVKIILSFGDALKENPTVTVKDSKNNKTDLRGPTIDGTKYTYRADINSSVREGKARVDISAKNIFNERMRKTLYFTVDRTPPIIQSVTPSNGSTVANTTSITASFKDTHSGIDTTCTTLLLTGGTAPADVNTAGLTYTPPAPLPQGTMQAQVNVCDLAGNVETRTWEFTVQ